ncbi:MAG: OmpH family outer membrane protein [Calditrichaeota bacterium]|nr:OmpH family outer membrane protein [Calditrichota bacterium]RQV93403.1 MAG: OmpH family outer membrane protein [bacterium]RQW06349.1 MAG: OmpH family outer membrane protein [Calditrichota bacterium]
MKNHRLFSLLTVGLVFLLFGWSDGHAQLKIRYVNSQRILSEYPEAQQIQKQLDDLRATYEKEYNEMLQRYENLVKEIENQSLLLSPEKKAEKEKEAQDLAIQIEQYRYEKLGPQGELYKKNMELTQPLYDKIDQIIQRVGDEEDYDYILDVVQGVVLFAKPQYDITNRIIEELTKGN